MARDGLSVRAISMAVPVGCGGQPPVDIPQGGSQTLVYYEIGARSQLAGHRIDHVERAVSFGVEAVAGRSRSHADGHVSVRY
ncbi:Uncharacterised protein [Mycobacteroides abscessus]|nr:Uncharacterised protein [Mycobacteroides abscessus]CPS19346.1 Uncharacterised protein [Mycobacteroides abscessus]CPS45862.1 Uncharacterised protein [Mycobacteroides abscessus]CPT09567.1 Uncharacterised protein [Mycobacteroides abscessus]CPT19064.1 Uncharacterised protein [Mycobacteroides abscessus]